MFQKLQLDQLLFLDIETVSQEGRFGDLPRESQELWEEKTRFQRKEEVSAEEFYERAGLMAEFGKIVCISVGHFAFKGEDRNFRVTSFYGAEPDLLKRFKQLLQDHFNRPGHLLCAHNGKEFDFPYIARRMIINGISLPHKLDLFGKKPWEVPHLDTMELWKFGEFRHYTSLKLLTHVLGIPSPKEDMDGSMVGRVYHEEGDLDRIVAYCELDVVSTAQVLLRLANRQLLSEEEIQRV